MSRGLEVESPAEEAGESASKELAEHLQTTHYAHKAMAGTHEAIAKVHTEASGYHTGRGNKELAKHHSALAELHSDLAAHHKTMNDSSGRVASAMREVHTNIPSTVTRAKHFGPGGKEAMLRAIAFKKAGKSKAPKSGIGNMVRGSD